MGKAKMRAGVGYQRVQRAAARSGSRTPAGMAMAAGKTQMLARRSQTRGR